MLGWLQLIVGALALAREVVKYLETVEKNKHATNLKIKKMRAAIRSARKDGNTDGIEKLFANLNVNDNNVSEL